jgi:hypothetical protein
MSPTTKSNYFLDRINQLILVMEKDDIYCKVVNIV